MRVLQFAQNSQSAFLRQINRLFCDASMFNAYRAWFSGRQMSGGADELMLRLLCLPMSQKMSYKFINYPNMGVEICLYSDYCVYLQKLKNIIA